MAPRYRSEEIDPDSVGMVDDTQPPLPRSGVYGILVLTRTAHSLIGSSGEVRSSPVPAAGQRPRRSPATLAENLPLLTTRLPPADTHLASLQQMLGKRPIALLFKPAAVSHVRGPVNDTMVALERELAGGSAILREEVNADDHRARGLKDLSPPDRALKAFHLQTEPCYTRSTPRRSSPPGSSCAHRR